jgi:hypothetical protein
MRGHLLEEKDIGEESVFGVYTIELSANVSILSIKVER